MGTFTKYQLIIGNHTSDLFNSFGECFNFFANNFSFIRNNPELRWWDGYPINVTTDKGNTITIEIERKPVSLNNNGHTRS
jgi:hypothetical protein